MKYLYAEEGSKYLATGDAQLQAQELEEDRIDKVSSAFRTGGTKVWLVVGSKDSMVNPEISARLCDIIATNDAKCDTLVGYSHAKVISHCLTITDEIEDFLIY